MKAPLLPLAVVLASSFSVGYADSRDRGREPRVILYQHADYRGDYLELYPGDSLDNFSGKTFQDGGRLNDEVSSIRVEGNIDLYVYSDAKFRGDALRLTESVRDLTGRLVSGGVSTSWNDRISSLKIERTRGGGGRDRDRDRDDDRPKPGPRGNAEKSVKAVFQDVLRRDPDPGELKDFTKRMDDQGWNERMLRDHLRNQERYRIEAAERIVKRAYLDVLGREADAGGLRSYRQKVMDRSWTEGDVKDDLRKSAEYRNKQGQKP